MFTEQTKTIDTISVDVKRKQVVLQMTDLLDWASGTDHKQLWLLKDKIKEILYRRRVH